MLNVLAGNITGVVGSSNKWVPLPDRQTFSWKFKSGHPSDISVFAKLLQNVCFHMTPSWYPSYDMLTVMGVSWKSSVKKWQMVK